MKKVPILLMGILGVSLVTVGCNNNQGATGNTDNNPNRTGYYNSVGTNRANNVGFTNYSGKLGDYNGLGDGYALNNNTGINFRRTGYTTHYGTAGSTDRYDLSRTNTSPHFGFVKANRAQLDSYSTNPISIDRTQLANSVAQSISSLPGISDATILVTDDHVYVGYTKDHLSRTNRTNNLTGLTGYTGKNGTTGTTLDTRRLTGTNRYYGTTGSNNTTGTSSKSGNGYTGANSNYNVYGTTTRMTSTDNMIKTAVQGIVPGYYKVHVSSDRNLTRRVSALVNNRTNYTTIDEQLDRILGK